MRLFFFKNKNCIIYQHTNSSLKVEPGIKFYTFNNIFDIHPTWNDNSVVQTEFVVIFLST